MVAQDALLREYQEIVNLILHEDRMAWELISIYLAIQTGLLSALGLTTGGFTIIEFLKYRWVIFLLGGIVSLVWYFIMCRSYMWRENWFNFGLRLERELNRRYMLELDFFEFHRHVREEKKALEFFKNENIVRERKQAWTERIGAIRPIHLGMPVLVFLWFVLLLVSIVLWLFVKS